PAPHRGAEGIDAFAAASRRYDRVAVAFESVAKRFDQERIVVYHQDALTDPVRRTVPVLLLTRHVHRHCETNPNGCPTAHRAFDLDVRAMSLHHAVHHGETQARTALALGRVEGLEAATPGFLIHADAGVGHRDFDMAWSAGSVGNDGQGPNG